MKSTVVNFLLAFSLLLLTSDFLSAQSLRHVPGELIVQFKPGYGPADLLNAQLRAANNRSPSIRHGRQIVPGMPIHLFFFDQNLFHEREILKLIKQHHAVQLAQFNHLTQLRSVIPNDEFFADQWQYVNSNGIDLDADLAWEYTTGGVTPLGDTIVVCIIDEGFNSHHPDLAPNLWVNRYEIPDNGIDDDQNGYIDDYLGWNTYLSNDSINVSGIHGTSVAGIVGARGNNGIGVSGVNWNVKLMLVVGGTGREDEALEAYGMALSHRKLYQETNGRRGAFVVATNASWGVDFLFAEDAPVWCAFYDSLGQYGILNAAATINRNVNVDLEGDMPTTCPSDFLIGVTNIDSTARKLNSAGYGNVSIDLGAFGHQVFTAFHQGEYRRFFGTSGSAPHVAGAIALLYSADCDQLTYLARSNPAAAARLVKEQIMLGTLGSASLDTTTVSGGRLNLLTSMQLLLSQCDNCIAPANLQISNIRQNEALLSWNTFTNTTSIDLLYKEKSEMDFRIVPEVESPFLLTNLTNCSEYDYSLRASCGTELVTTDTLTFNSACSTTNGSLPSSPEFETLPNPFQDQLTFSTNQLVDINIVNTVGQLVFSIKNVQGTKVLDLRELAAGIYFMEVGTSKKRWGVKILKY